eukprot:343092-Amphidinium_carterae.1
MAGAFTDATLPFSNTILAIPCCRQLHALDVGASEHESCSVPIDNVLALKRCETLRPASPMAGLLGLSLLRCYSSCFLHSLFPSWSCNVHSVPIGRCYITPRELNPALRMLRSLLATSRVAVDTAVPPPPALEGQERQNSGIPRGSSAGCKASGSAAGSQS